MFIAIGKVARLLGVSCTTLRRWDTDGTLKSTFRTPGGHRRYRFINIQAFISSEELEINKETTANNILPRAVTYARVSAVKQKDDLLRQEVHLHEYVNSNNWELVKHYKDIGSGLNDKRKGMLALIRDLATIQPEYLVCRFSDRLSRFGIEIIRTICSLFDTKIIITQDNDQTASIDDQLVKDVISLITSFAGKLYRRRRGKYTVNG